MRLALHEDLLTMKKGTPVVVNINDTISDVGIFVEYKNLTKKVVVLDCYSLGKDKRFHANLCDYDKCLMFDNFEAEMNNVSNLLIKGD